MNSIATLCLSDVLMELLIVRILHKLNRVLQIQPLNYQANQNASGKARAVSSP